MMAVVVVPACECWYEGFSRVRELMRTRRLKAYGYVSFVPCYVSAYVSSDEVQVVEDLLDFSHRSASYTLFSICSSTVITTFQSNT